MVNKRINRIKVMLTEKDEQINGLHDKSEKILLQFLNGVLMLFNQD